MTNPDPERGPFSSLQEGLSAVEPGRASVRPAGRRAGVHPRGLVGARGGGWRAVPTPPSRCWTGGAATRAARAGPGRDAPLPSRRQSSGRRAARGRERGPRPGGRPSRPIEFEHARGLGESASGRVAYGACSRHRRRQRIPGDPRGAAPSRRVTACRRRRRRPRACAWRASAGRTSSCSTPSCRT